MSKHTPGPWFPNIHYPRQILVRIPESGVLLAMCELLKWEGTDELESEQMANAALIASAPDMREELDRRDALIQEMLEALKGVSERQSFPTNSYPWWRAVQGAIAKAEE